MNGQAKTLKPSKSVPSAKVHTGIKKEKLTQERLKELLYYHPDTGVFFRKIDRGGRRAGTEAGSLHPSGYVHIRVDHISYKAHRLAWLYMEGYFPEHEVDHLKGILSDNRWNEIRHATHGCNLQNQKKYKNNISGFPGVSWEYKNKIWRSTININKKSYCVGLYHDPLEAALARYTAEIQCPEWTCNHRSELVKAIKNAWPEFNPC